MPNWASSNYQDCPTLQRDPTCYAPSWALSNYKDHPTLRFSQWNYCSKTNCSVISACEGLIFFVFRCCLSEGFLSLCRKISFRGLFFGILCIEDTRPSSDLVLRVMIIFSSRILRFWESSEGCFFHRSRWISCLRCSRSFFYRKSNYIQVLNLI